MKKFFMISALLAMVSGAFAQNSLSVGTTEVPQGGLGYIEVKYDFAQENYFANYSFDLYLPDGITLNTSSIVKGDCHSENHPKNYTINENDGFYSLAIMSNPTTALTGTSGLLVKLAVNVDSKLALESEHQGAIRKIRFASTGGSTSTFKDVEFTIKVVENIVTLDENSTTAPAAAENVNVHVKRSVKAGNWGTICLPFAMDANQVAAVFGEGTQLANFIGTEILTDDDELVSEIKVKFESVSAIEANHPYLLKSKNDITYDEGFKVEGVTINAAKTPQIRFDWDEDNEVWQTFFKGVYVPTVLSNKNWLFLSGNKFYYSNTSTTMKGFRGYFKFKSPLAAKYKDLSTGAHIGILIDDEATSIEGFTTSHVVEGVYDLSGRKIQLENGDLNKLQKGVYIIDGKKVTIK